MATLIVLRKKTRYRMIGAMDNPEMSEEAFAAYAAGFADGEGYIGVEPIKRRNVASVRIVIANTFKPALEFIRDRVGCGVVNSRKKYKAHYKGVFVLCMTSLSDCEKFLRLVRPYLIVKAAPADAALRRIEEAKQTSRFIRGRAIEIKALVETGMMRKDVAKHFSVSPQTISRICEGHKWPSERSRFAKTRMRDHRGLFVPCGLPKRSF